MGGVGFWIMAWAVSILLSCILTGLAVQNDTQDHWQKQAVSHGFASYHTTDEGLVTFQWHADCLPPKKEE